MSSTLSNPLLQATEQKVESNLTPETQANYQKIVVAGMAAALDKGPNSLLAQLQKSQDPIADAAKGAVSLIIVLRKQAQGIMPLKAAVPAAMTLLLKALDFIDRAKIMPIGQPELVRATHIFTDFVFARFGITKAGLQNAATKIHAITQDPEQMAKINLKAGVTQHPMAAKPTPLPGPAGMLNNGGGTDNGGAPQQ